jgi:HEAT repeat protein
LVCALAGATIAAPKKAARHAAAKVDLTPTIQALSGAKVETAAKAAQELGGSADPAAHDALLDALAMGLPPDVAVEAFTALAAHPAPPDVGALQRYAGHRNPRVRSAALGALAMYPAPDAKKAIVAGLHDDNATVRAAAGAAAAKGHIREAIEPLFALLARSDDSASKALAAMADPELARRIGDQLGKVPEPVLASTLGAILIRTDFGPDPARVEIVRAIGKIQDSAAVAALTDYLDKTPKQPARPSRDEADKMVQARLGGGGQ